MAIKQAQPLGIELAKRRIITENYKKEIEEGFLY